MFVYRVIRMIDRKVLIVCSGKCIKMLIVDRPTGQVKISWVETQAKTINQ